LKQEGFCITYLAVRSEKGQDHLSKMVDKKEIVTIKELFIEDCCERDFASSNITSIAGQELWKNYRKCFEKEAEKSLKLDHPNIMKVLEVFEDNNTVYIAMEYIEGLSLRDYVNKHGDGLPEAEAFSYICQIDNALKYAHKKGITHLGLNPANIIRRESDGTIKVADFGLLKLYNDTGENSSDVNLDSINEGYSPIELYFIDGWRQSCPASDIYSLGATFYFLLTGKTPPSAIEMLKKESPDFSSRKVSQRVQEAIVQAMQSEYEGRPKSIAKNLRLLNSTKEKIKEIFHSPHIWVRGVAATAAVAALGTLLVMFPFSSKCPSVETVIVNLSESDTLELVFVAGGGFKMGSTEGKLEYLNEEEKQITKGMRSFLIGRYEVTNRQWKVIMGEPLNTHYREDEFPVVYADSTKIKEFLDSLNNKCKGYNFRLPSEVEWEYASRGGRNSKDGYLYSGSDNIDAVAWYKNNSNVRKPVGGKSPNKLGIYDMSGNVREICSNKYDPHFNTDDNDSVKTPYQVIRGGSFRTSAIKCRSVHKDVFVESSDDIGFRVVATSLP
jgi:serine/threonine protein kinase